MVLKEVHTYLYPRSRRDLVGLQHLHGQVAAFDACQALLNVVSHICLHAQPVNTHLGQVHCLVDSCMASMEVSHDTVSAGQWNDHSFTLGKDVSIDRVCHGSSSKILPLWGHDLVSQANHSGCVCAPLRGWGPIVSLH